MLACARGGLCRHHNLYRLGWDDHRPMLSAETTSAIRPAVQPPENRMVMPPMSISTNPSVGGSGTASSCGATSRRANIGSYTGTTILPSRASRRQVDKCCAAIPCLRATSATRAPGSNDSATIRPFTSSGQARRPVGPSRTSNLVVLPSGSPNKCCPFVATFQITDLGKQISRREVVKGRKWTRCAHRLRRDEGFGRVQGTGRRLVRVAQHCRTGTATDERDPKRIRRFTAMGAEAGRRAALGQLWMK